MALGFLAGLFQTAPAAPAAPQPEPSPAELDQLWAAHAIRQANAWWETCLAQPDWAPGVPFCDPADLERVCRAIVSEPRPEGWRPPSGTLREPQG